MKKFTLTLFIVSTFWINAQNQPNDFDNEIKPLNQKIEALKFENDQLKNQINSLINELSNTKLSLDSLRILTTANSNAIDKTGKDLNSKITTTETNANNKISAVDKSLSIKTLYTIIGVLLALLLSGLLIFQLSKKQKSVKSYVEGQLSQTKKTIEDEQIQINAKLAEVYKKQLELLKTEKKAIQTKENIKKLKTTIDIIVNKLKPKKKK